MICFVVTKCRSLEPSMAYAASVHGEPMKPSMVDWPSISFRSVLKISRTNGNCESGSSSCFIALTSSIVRTGVTTGPFPFTTSNSIPNAGNGVKISLNMITPSGLNARHGCIDSSMAISGVSLRCLNPYLVLYARNSAMYLPA